MATLPVNLTYTPPLRSGDGGTTFDTITFDTPQASVWARMAGRAPRADWTEAPNQYTGVSLAGYGADYDVACTLNITPLIGDGTGHRAEAYVESAQDGRYSNDVGEPPEPTITVGATYQLAIFFGVTAGAGVRFRGWYREADGADWQALYDYTVADGTGFVGLDLVQVTIAPGVTSEPGGEDWSATIATADVEAGSLADDPFGVLGGGGDEDAEVVRVFGNQLTAVIPKIIAGQGDTDRHRRFP